jgi:hypothetical protein
MKKNIILGIILAGIVGFTVYLALVLFGVIGGSNAPKPNNLPWEEYKTFTTQDKAYSIILKKQQISPNSYDVNLQIFCQRNSDKSQKLFAEQQYNIDDNDDKKPASSRFVFFSQDPLKAELIISDYKSKNSYTFKWKEIFK